MLIGLIIIAELLGLYFLAQRTMQAIFKRLPFWLFAFLFLPGTLIHELSHFLTALVLLVPARRINLIPKRNGNEVQMGSVEIVKVDLVRRTLIGVAPVVFGLVIILFLIYATLEEKLFNQPALLVIIGFFIFQIANTMFSSKKDLQGSWIVFIGVSVLCIFLFKAGVRVDITTYQNILNKAALFLLVPILIDLLILGLYRRL